MRTSTEWGFNILQHFPYNFYLLVLTGAIILSINFQYDRCLHPAFVRAMVCEYRVNMALKVRI